MPDDRERRIREKAHELWEQAGRPEGQEKEHWSEAERVIDAQAPASAEPAKPTRSRAKKPAEEAAAAPKPKASRPTTKKP